MKKIIVSIFCLGILSVLSADMTRVGLGVGSWQQKSGGDASYTEGNYAEGKYKSDEITENQAYIWIDVKHPVPIIPNIRAEYVKVRDEGKVTGHFKKYDVGLASVDAEFEMKQYDIILYYNLLDKMAQLLTLDVGLDAKIIDLRYETDVFRDNITGITADYSDTINAVVPLAYVRARVELPFNLGLEANGKYIGYNGSSVSDLSAKLDYTMEFIPLVHPALEVGYRYQRYYFDDDDDEGDVDLDFGGWFVGIAIKY